MAKVINKRHRAFTLVEIIVAMAVFSVLSYVIYDMFVGGMKAFKKEEGKTESLEAALLAYEMISKDIRSSIYYGVQSAAIAEVLPIGLADPGPTQGETMTLTANLGLDQFPDKLPTARVAPIVYRLVDSGKPDFKYLSRNGKVLHTIKLKELSFEYKLSERTDGKSIVFLSVKIMGYGEREKDHSLISGLLALDSYSLRAIHPYWGQNLRTIAGGS